MSASPEVVTRTLDRFPKIDIEKVARSGSGSIGLPVAQDATPWPADGEPENEHGRDEHHNEDDQADPQNMRDRASGDGTDSQCHRYWPALRARSPHGRESYLASIPAASRTIKRRNNSGGRGGSPKRLCLRRFWEVASWRGVGLHGQPVLVTIAAVRIFWSRTAWTEFQVRHPDRATLIAACCGGTVVTAVDALGHGAVGHVCAAFASGVIGSGIGQRLRYRYRIQRSAVGLSHGR